MTEVRRSTRIRDKSSRTDGEGELTDSMGFIHADDQIDFGSDSGDEEEEEHDSEDDDDEYHEATATNKRKKKNSLDKQNSRRNVKKARTSYASKGSKKTRDAFVQMQQGFEPTQLFVALSQSADISVEEVANEWLDLYAKNRSKALQEFINFILNCSGSLVQVQEHDVISNETANETVGEIQLLFQKQELHESYLLMSKTSKRRAKFKPLYQNFVEFMGKLIELANERGMLYNTSETDERPDSGSLILDLLTWLSSFSVSKIRCLRHAATICMYSFQDYLTELSVDLENNYLVKLRRQLGLEQSKKRANRGTASKLQSTITEIQETKSVVENSIDNIIKLAFVHRFKDVDEAIRADSILHLATWLENYPEYFMKVTFLKYFGWLLSDMSSTVRLQVLRVLLEIVKFDGKRSKHKVGNSALRQFFERFKQRVLEICLKDVDMQVRRTAILVLTQINPLGYLEDQEISKVSSLLFSFQRMDTTFAAKHAKFLDSVAKFVSSVQEDKMEQIFEAHTFPHGFGDLPSDDIVRIGFFMQSLITSLSEFLRASEDESNAKEKARLLFQAAEFLQPYCEDLITPICKLLVLDENLNVFAEVEDEENEGNKLLLLPIEENSIIQYVVVLSGFCRGVTNTKSVKKSEITTSVLSQLGRLFSSLPLHSDVVIQHLYDIYMLFEFEDWVSANRENDFQVITETIVKTFDRMQLNNDEHNNKREIYAKVLEYHQRLNLPNINEMWKDQVDRIRISLQVYLDTKAENLDGPGFNEVFTTVFDTYVSKLVLLGKVMPLDFTSEFIQLFFAKVVDRLPEALQSLNEEALASIDIRFIALVVTWNLQQWFEILSNGTDAVPVSEGVLEMASSVIRHLSNDLIILTRAEHDELQQRLNLEWKVCNTLADCLTAYKMFELNLPQKDHEWKRVISQEYPAVARRDIGKVFLETFLYLESLWARELGVQLDRLEDEDVNLNDISDDTIENVEQELVVFAVKIKSLLKLGVLDNSTLQDRISLNESVLGETYRSVIDETAFSVDTAPPKRSLASANHERQIFEDHRTHSPDNEADPASESLGAPDLPVLAETGTVQEDTEPHGYSSELL